MAKETPVEELNYEQALKELETIVVGLESGEHPLDEALALFERGQVLYQRCTELLDKAELKVRQLTEEGELKDFEA
jgi:exodeoxyribonuclease VII small subunit